MSAEVIQLNKSLRQVSSRLHSQWWTKIDLEPWQDIAKKNELISQRLDNVILSRLGYEKLWLTEDREVVLKWLSVLHRLPLLLTAAGLIVQNCPDYIWDNHYRKVMQGIFSQSQIEQLIALWPFTNEPPVWTPNNMLEKAEYFSASALYHSWSSHPFWPMLSLSLPVVEKPIELSELESANVVSWIFRLEKFL